MFGKLFGKSSPTKRPVDVSTEQIRAGIVGCMRHANAMFDIGNNEEGLGNLIDAFNVARIACGFSDLLTQQIVNEIALHSYDCGLKESGLKFEALRWLLHIKTNVKTEAEGRACWDGKNVSFLPDADVRAYFQRESKSLEALVDEFWLPTTPPMPL